MPLRDGKGPLGFGSQMGHGRGWCGMGIGYNRSSMPFFHGKRGWFWSITAPLAIAILRDLGNPCGLLQHLASVFLLKKKGNQESIHSDAEFTVIENETPKKALKTRKTIT